MGVRLQEARVVAAGAAGAAGRRPLAGGRSLPARVRARSSRRRRRSPPWPATSSGCQLEYRRAVRRARALQDVLLPELDRTVYEIETRLEELEQEDAIWMRRGATVSRGREYNTARWTCARRCWSAIRPSGCST